MYGYINAYKIVVATIATTTTIMIIDDTIFCVFLLFILNIFVTLTLFILYKNFTVSERILYMRFPFLASFIAFIIFFTIVSKKAEKRSREKDAGYWEREQKANATRKVSLESLDYIVIPFSTLPMQVEAQDEIIAQCIREIQELAGEKIVNLTGFSNTDLKLEYGTANITPLSKYDQNFTILVRILQTWAGRLNDLGHSQEALIILDFAIAIRTDISSSYYLAARLYAAQGNTAKIQYLKRTASTLQSAMKNAIVHTLQESYPDDDSPHFL